MLSRKGQSTLEYALIIAVVVGGLLLMQHYVKRGYSGRLKTASDEMGEQFDPSTYEADLTIHQESETRQIVKDRVTETKHLKDQVSRRTGTEDVGAWEEDQDLFKQ